VSFEDVWGRSKRSATVKAVSGNMSGEFEKQEGGQCVWNGVISKVLSGMIEVSDTVWSQTYVKLY